MRKFQSLIGSLSIAASVSLSVFSGTALGAVVELGTGYDWPPFHDESMVDGGHAATIVKEVFEDMGASYEFKILPWTRAYNEAAAGRLHGTFLWYDSVERREKMHYSKPLLTVNTSVFMKAGKAAGRTSLEDLTDTVLCIPNGNTVLKAIQAKIDAGDIRLTTAKTALHCLKLVKAGRADAVVDAQPVLMHTARQNAMSDADFDILPVPVAQSPLHVLFSKKWDGAESFVEKFNISLSKLKESGRVDEILR